MVKEYILKYEDKIIIKSTFKKKMFKLTIETRIADGYKNFVEQLKLNTTEGVVNDFQEDVSALLKIDEQFLELKKEKKIIDEKALRLSLQQMYIFIAKKWKLIYLTNDLNFKKE